MSSEALPETTSGPSIILNVEGYAEQREEIAKLLATIEQNEPDTSAETLGRLETALASIHSCRRRLEALLDKINKKIQTAQDSFDREKLYWTKSELRDCDRFAQVKLNEDANTPFELFSIYRMYNRMVLPGFDENRTARYSKKQGWFMQNKKVTFYGEQSLEVSAGNGKSHLSLGSIIGKGEDQVRMIHGTDPVNVQVMPGKPNIRGKYVWGAWSGLRSPSLRVKSFVGMAPIDMIEEQARILSKELKTCERKNRWHL